MARSSVRAHLVVAAAVVVWLLLVVGAVRL